jgi:hypothetical protein
VLSIGDDLIGGQFAESELDTGGIELDAYFSTLYANWKEAHETMGLPADDDTYRHYIYVRHLALFGLRKDNFGNFVTAEKRLPPRLTPDENLALIEEVKRDMALVEKGLATLAASGSLTYRVLPNDGAGSTVPRAGREHSDPLRRRSRPSDVFGTPDAPDLELPNRMMRPDDSFGTPGTRIYRDDLDAAEVFRSALAPRPAPTPTPIPSPSVRARRRRR